MLHQRIITLCGVCFGLACLLLAPPAQATFVKGPHLQNLTTEGVTVLWEQATPGPGTVTVGSQVFTSSVSQTIHEVVLTGLTPATAFSYVVDADGATDGGGFTTAPTDPLHCFVFLASGDNRSIHADHSTVVNALLTEADADFLINTGDMVSSGEIGADWQFFFDIEYPLIRDLPWYPSVGNHEEDGGALPVFYTDYLAPPTDTSGEEAYYSFTYANSTFIVIDFHVNITLLGSLNSAQTNWLAGEFAAAQANLDIQHIFVIVHMGAYSSKDARTGHWATRELMNNDFLTNNVDAVISGHDHHMERGESPDGVRYFVMGGGGAPLYTNENEGNTGWYAGSWQAIFADARQIDYAQAVHGYTRFEVCNGQVDVSIKGTNGAVLDTTSWNTGDVLPPGPDAGVPEPDAAIPEPDAAPPQVDAAPPSEDASTPAVTPDATPAIEPPADNPDAGCQCRNGGSANGAALIPLLFLLPMWWRRRRR